MKIPWRKDRLPTPVFSGSPGGSGGKESTCNVGDLGSNSALGRSPGAGYGNPSILAWRIPWTEAPDGLQYTGSQRIRHDWAAKHRTAHTLSRLLKLRLIQLTLFAGFPCGSSGQESACNTGDLGSIPGLGRSPKGGNIHPLKYSGLENSMDSIVHGVTKSRTRVSNFHSRLFATFTAG